MIKKFLVKLVNWQAQRTGAEQFHQREAAERDNAKYNEELAKQRMQNERGERDWVEVPLPTETKDNKELKD